MRESLRSTLTGIGYAVERTESAEPAETRLSARLVKMNPAIPPGASELAFRLVPTSGGAALAWLAPTGVPEAERGRTDRLAREIAAHLERTVLTESHATAKVTRAPDVRLPWEPAK